MAETSKIEWTDATVNFWWGCTKVGPGCDHCYAEDYNAFRGNGEWGPGAPRTKVKGAVALIRKLNRQHAKFFAEHGRHRRVFCSSMSDMFDNEIDPAWRDEAFREIDYAPSLDIQIVTKRVSNISKLVPDDWQHGGWPCHVGVLITVCKQEEADRDVPRLLALKDELIIPWVGLSMEPLLEGVVLRDEWLGPGQLDWIIVGGESGRNARLFDLQWARAIMRQCGEAGVHVHVKQLGSRPVNGALADIIPEQPDDVDAGDLAAFAAGFTAMNLKHPKGADWSEWAGDLRVREWPEVVR